MKINSITTELMTDDVSRSVEFYTQLLGFNLVTSVPESDPFFVILQNNQTQLMIYHRQQFAEEIPKFKSMKIGGSIALYVEITDIRGEYEKLKDKVSIIQKLHSTDYGTQEFSFEDPDKYVIMLHES